MIIVETMGIMEMMMKLKEELLTALLVFRIVRICSTKLNYLNINIFSSGARNSRTG